MGYRKQYKTYKNNVNKHYKDIEPDAPSPYDDGKLRSKYEWSRLGRVVLLRAKPSRTKDYSREVYSYDQTVESAFNDDKEQGLSRF